MRLGGLDPSSNPDTNPYSILYILLASNKSEVGVGWRFRGKAPAAQGLQFVVEGLGFKAYGFRF